MIRYLFLGGYLPPFVVIILSSLAHLMHPYYDYVANIVDITCTWYTDEILQLDEPCMWPNEFAGVDWTEEPPEEFRLKPPVFNFEPIPELEVREVPIPWTVTSDRREDPLLNSWRLDCPRQAKYLLKLLYARVPDVFKPRLCARLFTILRGYLRTNHLRKRLPKPQGPVHTAWSQLNIYTREEYGQDVLLLPPDDPVNTLPPPPLDGQDYLLFHYLLSRLSPVHFATVSAILLQSALDFVSEFDLWPHLDPFDRTNPGVRDEQQTQRHVTQHKTLHTLSTQHKIVKKVTFSDDVQLVEIQEHFEEVEQLCDVAQKEVNDVLNEVKELEDNRNYSRLPNRLVGWLITACK